MKPVTSRNFKDLVIRLDEGEAALQLLTPQRANDLNTLTLLCAIAEGDSDRRSNLEQQIGMAVLSYFSAVYSTSSFFLNEYREAGKQMKQHMGTEAKSLMTMDGADEEFEAALLLIHGFDESWQSEDIEKVTALLERAAKKGLEKAQTFLKNDWPKISVIFKKRFERDKGI